MRFSIIIPSYNQQEFLADAIESALSQTVPCEVIVIDDGSTDNSLAIARSYEPKIKVISQVNKSLASARNTGIMNASGDYILPLDADDILLEKCIETMQVAANRTGSDVLAPSFKTFGIYNQEVILTTLPTIKDFITGNRIGYFSAIKRSVLLEIGGYSPRMKFGYEDYHIWFDIFKRGKTLTLIPEVLVLYRTKEHSMLTDALKHHQELMQQIIKDHEEVFQP